MSRIAIGWIELDGDSREEGALDAADDLTREVVAATGALPAETPEALGRSLREAAVLAQAGMVAACREQDPRRAVHALWAAEYGLRRLGVWIDLAHRFGDVGAETTRRLTAARDRVRQLVETLAADRGEADLTTDRGMTLDVNNVMRYGTS